MVATVGEMASEQNTKAHSRSVFPLRVFCSVALCDAVVGRLGGCLVGNDTYSDGNGSGT